MTEFTKGTEVQINWPQSSINGWVGIIVGDKSLTNSYPIRFENKHSAFGDLGGLCEPRRGYWIRKEYLKLNSKPYDPNQENEDDCL